MYLGLFTHFDRIVKYNKRVEKFLKETGFFDRFLEGYLEGGKEFLISKEEFEILRKLKGKRRIGGNAGNAAQFLSFNGIKTILSVPFRPKSLMKMLGRNVYVVCNKEIREARRCWRKDPEIEHIIVEKGETRVIFTYDPVSENFILDKEFWEFISKPLFISGFHVVYPNIKNIEKTKEISDAIYDKEIITWLELGGPLRNMRVHLRILMENEFVRFIGMNDKEARIFSRDVFEIPKILYERGKYCFIHSKDFWILSSERKIDKKVFLEISRRLNLWAIGKKIPNVVEIKEVSKKPFVYCIKLKPFKRLRRATGLGDSLSSLFFLRLQK